MAEMERRERHVFSEFYHRNLSPLSESWQQDNGVFDSPEISWGLYVKSGDEVQVVVVRQGVR